jgi:RNA polymerase sigma-70 factor (ECF subfamily)
MTDEEVLRDVYGSVRAFAAVVAPREVAPDDLVHDAILRALRSGPLSRLDHPAAYLRRAVANEASNQRRRLGRARRAHERAAGGLEESAYDVYPTDLAHLDELDPEDRAVLFLHDVEGFSFAEIGRDLGLTEAAARQRASRARRRLEDLLGGVS